MDPPASRGARWRMAAGQLEARGILDRRVLEAMSRIPRERFVPPEWAEAAYDDGPLPIGCDQTLSQPYMVAVMSELLELRGPERVLEIGAGSGYGAAVLGLLAARVVAVERIPQLLDEARERWRRLGLDHVVGAAGDGTLGWPPEAPYDAICVTAGAPAIPRPLIDQLRPGGVMVIPVGSRYIQGLWRVRRGRNGLLEVEKGLGCRFVPLLGRDGWKNP
ncbi:MAG: protein-L-isoaspartate(D-aspartate) O-methyltransferase [Magnetococcales bacterium]|nr:protein-L-isoaspartate(D-aspartate) O-methyltransferase [Magnetococcales bacterium]